MSSKTRSMPAPLVRKLLILGALPATVMFFVLIVFFTTARIDDARRELSTNGQLLADSLSPALEYAVVAGNNEALQSVLSESLRHSSATWIRVTDVVGEQLGFASNGTLNSPFDSDQYLVYEAEILQQPLELNSDDTQVWFAPEYGFGAGALRVGTIEVGVDTAVFDHRRQDILWTSIAVGLVILLFTLLIAHHYLSTILSPIRQLSDRVARLIQGDYSEQPVKRAPNSREVVQIEEHINELAAQLGDLRRLHEQNLTAAEAARDRADSANQAKSEFLATMSHELRTPLNGVLGMIELIQDESLTARQQDYLSTARQSTEDLLTVIGDILDYSKIDGGSVKLDHQAFDLPKLISNCVSTFRFVAEQQGLTLNLSFNGDWPPHAMVMGDAPRLRQALAGLVDNAIKFTADGFINIQANCFVNEPSNMIFSCSVTDSGTGIPSDQLTNIFNSFEQLDYGNTRKHAGTGLGLSITQRLVELMGGHIQVDTNIGEGSSFRFELPFELASPVKPQPVRPTTTPNGQLIHALVVEDNPVNQKVACAMLRRLGFETDAANNGNEALEKIRRNHTGYDVILMDCHMPVMDGYETTRQIRSWEKDVGQHGVPIVALTADVLPETRDNCLKSGMNDYLAKPVKRERLEKVLSQWFELEA
ncbi:response regulator [Marinobacter sp. F4216]|uniref:HAMP domain-containing hybrid sensor histidine kinase/response regulator n=1 Tax=Marinobacter sp. F4216 TaxID=2874281 RepID=UPI001CBF00DC|nr:response regulator [Marinobacter sp. F4216]